MIDGPEVILNGTLLSGVEGRIYMGVVRIGDSCNVNPNGSFSIRVINTEFKRSFSPDVLLVGTPGKFVFTEGTRAIEFDTVLVDAEGIFIRMATYGQLNGFKPINGPDVYNTESGIVVNWAPAYANYIKVAECTDAASFLSKVRTVGDVANNAKSQFNWIYLGVHLETAVVEMQKILARTQSSI